MKTFTLTVKVTYEQNGVEDSELSGLLYNIADYAANNGMMTEDTEAVVETWSANVEYK